MALQHDESLAFTLSQLKHRVISAPPFWNSAVGLSRILGDIPDENVLNEIFEAALSAEFKYLAEMQEKRDKALERGKKAAEAIIEAQDKEDEEAPKKNVD